MVIPPGSKFFTFFRENGDRERVTANRSLSRAREFFQKVAKNATEEVLKIDK